jgi:hypothetical protein
MSETTYPSRTACRVCDYPDAYSTHYSQSVCGECICWYDQYRKAMRALGHVKRKVAQVASEAWQEPQP